MNFQDMMELLYPEYYFGHRIDMKMNDHKIIDYLRLIFPDIVDLTYTTSKHDFIIPSKNDGGEIKVRRRHYENEWGIDIHKYRYMMENKFYHYVVWTPGDRTLKDIQQGLYYPKMYMWKLDTIKEPEWMKRPGRTSTDYAHHQEIMDVEKTFGYLNISDAIELTHLLYQ